MMLGRKAFTLLETFVTLALVGIVLQLVVQGYQELFRISHSSKASQNRIDQLRLCQQITGDITSAITVIGLKSDRMEFTKLSQAATQKCSPGNTNPDRWPSYLPDPLPEFDNPPPFPAYNNAQVLTVSYLREADPAQDGLFQLRRRTAGGPANQSRVLLAGIEEVNWNQREQSQLLNLTIKTREEKHELQIFLALVAP